MTFYNKLFVFKHFIKNCKHILSFTNIFIILNFRNQVDKNISEIKSKLKLYAPEKKHSDFYSFSENK